MVRMSWPHYVESCIWLPAILLFLLRALRTEHRGRALLEAAAGGLCMGMSILTGGVQYSMMQAIVVVTALFWYGIATLSPGGNSSAAGLFSGNRAYWLRLATVAAVILAVAFGLGAAQLFPAYEYGHLSLRSIAGGWYPMSDKIPYDRMDHGMWPESIVTGLFPAGFDGKIGGGEAWPFYIGAFPFILAVIAIWKCWSNLWVRYMTGLALVTFLYTLGEFSPLNGILYALVPFLWMAREPSRFLYLVSFALAALAAFGLDTLFETAGQTDYWAPARPYLKWISIVCSAALFLPAVFTQLNVGLWTIVSLLLILASAAWFHRLTVRQASPAMRVILAAFIFFDLASFNWLEANWNTLIKAGDQYEQMLNLRPAAMFLKSRPGLFRVRVSADPEPNVGDIYGIQSLWGGGATILTDFSRIIGHEDLLNVRYHIKPNTSPDPNPIYKDSLWKVYEDKNGFDRAWLVHQVVVEPMHDAVFTRMDAPGTDLHTTAIVESPLPRPLDPPGADGTVRFRSYEADSMALDVTSSGSALLVLSELYYPGWRATVNGHSVEIRKVDGALRGILVPSGKSQVVLEYVPMSFYLGAGLSGLTAICVFAAWLILRRQSNGSASK